MSEVVTPRAWGGRLTPRAKLEHVGRWEELGGVVTRRWKEPVKEVKGEGLLRDPNGQTSRVDYRFTIRQNCWERGSINAPPSVGRGTFEASGTLVPIESIMAIDSPSLVLELNNGQQVKVIIRQYSGPFGPIPIQVSGFDALLPSEEL